MFYCFILWLNRWAILTKILECNSYEFAFVAVNQYFEGFVYILYIFIQWSFSFLLAKIIFFSKLHLMRSGILR